ncbi:CLUMA_CG014033, isoform A [Clunio marinus]|uniref:CLUMA_CG014033, isoform A n=1 Tax=Clunio marinus TaxID=568069 RepID=A0A1J1IM05_9DIPT|nr:CLUMA_CG014033, isoform A [Clunio marinus]
MELAPPKVYGLKILDKERFNIIAEIPTIKIGGLKKENMNQIVKNLKKDFLKLDHFRPKSNEKIFLNPGTVSKWEDLPCSNLESLGVNSSSFGFEKMSFGYENWKADDLIKAIIPEESVTFCI